MLEKDIYVENKFNSLDIPTTEFSLDIISNPDLYAV